ncbi:MAG: hypothetical protein ACRES3_02500 [Steroidobacteraceae bacterium]
MKIIHRVACIAAALFVAPPAIAQSVSSVKIGTAALMAPGTANTAYGDSAISTNSSWHATPNEITELARALENDPDLLYDFVRNNVETIWMYGLQKGALGALIDRRGTAFDQAHLMAELLRASNPTFTVSYLAGTITLNATQFSDWTGVSKAQAACQLLSSGGIPAVINGTTPATCNYGTANVTSVQLSHIWLSVTISGTAYVFDPSYKLHSFKTGLNLTTVTGLTPGQALAAASATPGTEQGVTFVQNLNVESLNSTLQTYGGNLRIQILSALPAGEIEDVVGGSEIIRDDAQHRDTVLPYAATVQRTWTGGIPDQYRTKLQVQITKTRPDASTPTIINQSLFVDEIYGRKLIFDTNFQEANFVGSLRVLNEFGSGSTIQSANFTDNPKLSYGTLTLTANHPYIAAADGSQTTSGTYMDRTISKPVQYATPLIVVHGWGETGRTLVDKWSTRLDKGVPPLPSIGCENCAFGFFMSAGDGKREQLAASWLAQSSVAARLHAEIADSIYTHHHSLGLVGANSEIRTISYTVPGGPPDFRYALLDNFDRIDVDSSISVTSKTSDATARRAAIHAIAATTEALEGSVAAQIADLPDTNSTATRFGWGNRPPTAEDPSGASSGVPRRFYDFNSGNSSLVSSLALVEGQATNSNDGIHGGNDPEIGATEFNSRKNALQGAVQAYTTAGFGVAASGEAFLGPGQRGGAFNPVPPVGSTFTHRYSPQRGGAFVATRYTGSDPVEIAHIVVGPDANAKGGGGGVQPAHEAMYDPSKAADVLKARFVDRSRVLGVDPQTGGVTYESPASLTVGNGGFPYALTASLIWRGGPVRSELFGPVSHVEPSVPWTTNWNNTLTVSGSGLEMMGEGDVRAVAGTVAAFLAMQDVYKAGQSLNREVVGPLVASWWVGQLTGNAVTVNVGADTRQFIRDWMSATPNAWFLPGPGSYAELTQTNNRSKYVEPNCSGGEPSYVLTRGWNYTGVSFQVKNAQGDIQSFAHWKKIYRNPGADYCATQRGFRMSQWTFPYNMQVNLVYAAPSPDELDELVEVNNSLGRKITFVESGRGGFANGLTGGDLRSVAVSATGTLPTTTIHTDPSTAQTKFIHTVSGGRNRLDDIFAADNMSVAAVHYDYDTLIRAKEVKDAVALQVGGRAPYQFLLADGVRAARIDPENGKYQVLYDLDGRPRKYIDEVGNATKAEFDGRGRVTKYIYAELDEERLLYDARNNVTELRRVAKPSSGLADLVIEASWNPTWNKPDWIEDAKDQRTNFVYRSTGNGISLLETATRPTINIGTPVYSFVYSSRGQITTATDPTGLATSNSYHATNGNLLSTTINPSGLALATNFTYDAQGDVAVTTDPRGNATQATYDLNRRKTVTRQHNGASPADVLAAQRTSYDVLGRVFKEEAGLTFSGTSVSTWQTLRTIAYTPTSQVSTETNAALETTTKIYDDVDRLLEVTDAVGRRTRFAYDLAGKQLQEIRGYGSPLQANYATYQYSPNGQRTTIKDANNNLSTLEYDGFDRLFKLRFPSTTLGAGTSSTTDYEQYGYDANGNRTSLRKRNGQTITYGFDALDRQTVKNRPDGGLANDVFYDYDLAGRPDLIRLAGSGSTAVDYVYDTAKRLIRETTYSQQVNFQLDAAGNRTRLTWPDGNFVQYDYDALNRVTAVRENGATSGVGVLATYVYDPLSRRTSVTRGNAANSALNYDLASRLISLNHNLASTAHDVTFALSYTPAGQLLNRTQANALYAWTVPTVNRAYVRDGLNRYTSVAGVTHGYDTNGNLMSHCLSENVT